MPPCCQCDDGPGSRLSIQVALAPDLTLVAASCGYAHWQLATPALARPSDGQCAAASTAHATQAAGVATGRGGLWAGTVRLQRGGGPRTSAPGQVLAGQARAH
jgi:hypothetical protein